MYDEILEKIVMNCNMDVPESLVEEEFKLLNIEMSHRMQYEALTTGVIHFLTPEEKEENLKLLQHEAYKRVKINLYVQTFIKKEALDVTDEELKEEAIAISKRQNVSLESIYDFLGNDMAALRNDLLYQKAVKKICQNKD